MYSNEQLYGLQQKNKCAQHGLTQNYYRLLESPYALRLQYSTAYRDSPRTLNELKTATLVYIRNISQADLQ
jgi:hypothetical protein